MILEPGEGEFHISTANRSDPVTACATDPPPPRGEGLGVGGNAGSGQPWSLLLYLGTKCSEYFENHAF